MSEKANFIGKKTNRGKEAKGWFLTYPQCPMTPEEALDQLKAKETIVEYVVAREEHKDGSLHLHAFIKLEKKRQFKTDRFDIQKEEKTYHGNYQIAKSWKAVEAYCKKGGNFIANIDVESAKAKKGKKNLQLARMDPREAVESGEINFMDLPKLMKAQALWSELSLFRTESEGDELPKDRHRWIHGPSNSGKTTQLRQMMKDLGENDFFQIPQNNDWIGYTKQKYLWMDEYKGQLTIQFLNSLCDGDLKVNTKGGSARIRRNPYVIILSNYSIEECYTRAAEQDRRVIEALKNRFREEEKKDIYK